VVEVNTTLTERPEVVNTDPHGTWMVVLELTEPDQTTGLLDAAAYAELVA